MPTSTLSNIQTFKHIIPVNGPLMKPKFKHLSYKNVIFDPIFMTGRRNQSHVYVGTWQPIQVTVSKCNTWSIQQATVTITCIFSKLIQSSND